MAVESAHVCEFWEFGHNFWYSGKLMVSSFRKIKNYGKSRSELGDAGPQSWGQRFVPDLELRKRHISINA